MKIQIIIDGSMVQVEEGTMLIRAASQAGIIVPTLCHHEGVKPYGSCRLCMVEMVQSRQRRLVTSCNYPAEPGMEVFTNTERVRKIRRILVALLLARCPDVPVLQTMARQMGIEKSGLKKKGDQRCILCGLCVRFCEEVVGVSAIGLANRGTEREVATPFKTGSSVCIGCGSCSYICPTSCIEMVPDPSNAELRCLTMGSQSLSACTSSECETCSTDDEFLREMKQAVSAFRSQAGKPLP